MCYHIIKAGESMIKQKNINLRIDEETFHKLENIAIEEETSVSSIIRKAIKEFIRNGQGKESR